MCDECLPKPDRAEMQKSLILDNSVKDNQNNYMICVSPVENEDVINDIVTQQITKQVDEQEHIHTSSPISPMFEISSETPRLSRDVVTKNLSEISKLCEYQKLWLNGDILEIDNSWMQPITRWTYGQSKENIVPIVIETVKCALIYESSENQKEITNLLISSVTGLKNLKVTYPSKKDQLDMLVEKIEKLIYCSAI